MQDAVITGLNRNEVGALIVPRVEELRRFAAAGAEATLGELLRDACVQCFLQTLMDHLAAAATGSANRLARIVVLEQALAIDAGEVTDKGSVNQRAVLARRAALVERLYDDAADLPHRFIAARRGLADAVEPP